MFSSLQNIQSAFALSRLYVILITIFSLCICGFSVYYAFSFAEKQREKIYVLDGGKSLMLALSQDINQNREAEAKSHVSRFHDYFFTLSPDKIAIEDHIHQALALADNDAANMYIRMKEEGFFERMIAAGIFSEIKIDSVRVDNTTYPFKAYTYGMTSIVRSSTVTYRNLYTVCDLVNTSRSDMNPHGFIIENWKIIDNSDIKTINRD